LNPFLSKFSEVRKACFKNYLQPEDYTLLPYGKAVAGDSEWKLRRYDLKIVLSVLEKQSNQAILELGGYNGWLTHHIAAMGHDVTTVDYFLDDLDGLKTRKFYGEKWKSIQMDIRDIYLLDQKFDAIIVNRCLQFFVDPIQYFRSLSGMLETGGMIILTGLQIFKKPERKIEVMKNERQEFLKRYGFDRMFVPFKGYLDAGDKQQLLAAGVLLKKYPQFKIANFRAWINPELPVQYYGIFRND
ncbi:MAG: class I SAM-dependent methyltransferase, partial [Calditrichia bacterium]